MNDDFMLQSMFGRVPPAQAPAFDLGGALGFGASPAPAAPPPVADVALPSAAATSADEARRGWEALMARGMGGAAAIPAAPGQASAPGRSFGKTFGSTLGGASSGAVLGSAVPGIGTVAGAVVGGIGGFLGSLF